MSKTLSDAIRDVPDFPKPGILFKDITPILQDPSLFKLACEKIKQSVTGLKIDKVVALDARGFLFGAPVALDLNAGFIPIRKPGKLPWQTLAREYQLEYGSNTLEIHRDAIAPGDKILLVDDLLATGGTAAAAISLLRELGADIVCASFLIELSFLGGRSKLDCDIIQSILIY